MPASNWGGASKAAGRNWQRAGPAATVSAAISAGIGRNIKYLPVGVNQYTSEANDRLIRGAAVLFGDILNGQQAGEEPGKCGEAEKSRNYFYWPVQRAIYGLDLPLQLSG